MKATVFNNVSLMSSGPYIRDLKIVNLDESPEVIFVRSKDLKKIDLPKSLVAIGRAGSGVDNIPLDWCNQNGVAVFNAPGANSNAVKELVLLALVQAARPAFQASAEVVKNDTDPEVLKKGYKGSELAGKAILVIGLGQIGKRVAEMCYHLGMDVYGHDPYLNEPTKILGMNFVPLDAILPDINYVTLHCALTPENYEMVGKGFLADIQPGAKILNFARGELVNNLEMLKALQDGRVAKYISDFPPNSSFKSQMLETGSAMFFPHLGASTEEAEEKAAMLVAQKANSFLEDGLCTGSVNFPDMPMEKVQRGRIRLLVSNLDQPEMIARITKAVSTAELNIGSMVNKSRNGIALNYIDLDLQNADGRLLAASEIIKEIEGVTRIRVITPF
ncbi:MAG: NAD(P)-dependent oxidoreductase [bacterium]|nr:NAD(P)-dependent oxidoreductase [bacterium]